MRTPTQIDNLRRALSSPIMFGPAARFMTDIQINDWADHLQHDVD